MHQEPKIVTLENKKLIGLSIEMSLVNNKNAELFPVFMPQRKHIKNTISDAIYEVMIYNHNHFQNFSPTHTFTKWATVEVLNYDAIPNGMKTLDLETGLYAVFKYKGLPQGFGKLMQYILSQWLPQSQYQLDNRPHFNILGEKDIKGSPGSEEDVFIPIKIK